MVAQQHSYYRVLFIAAPPAKTPSGQSLSNSTSCAAAAYAAGAPGVVRHQEAIVASGFYCCSPFGHSPGQVKQWRLAEPHTLPHVGQTPTTPSFTCTVKGTLVPGALRLDLAKCIGRVELSWERFSFTCILFCFG